MRYHQVGGLEKMTHIMFVALEVLPQRMQRSKRERGREKNLWLPAKTAHREGAVIETVRRLMGVSTEDSQFGSITL